MITMVARLFIVAALLLAFATSSYAADSVTLASPSVSRLIGQHFGVTASPSGRSFCEYRSALAGTAATVTFHSLNPAGTYRPVNVINDNDVNGNLLSANRDGTTGYGLACTDNQVFVIAFDGLAGSKSIWQTGTKPGTTKVLLVSGQDIVTDKGSYRYFGGAINFAFHGNNVVLLTNTASSTIAVELLPDGTKHLLADLGSTRYVLGGCVAGDSVFAVSTYDGTTGSFERFGSDGSNNLLESVPDIGYNVGDQILARQTYTLGCGPVTSALVFQQNGGLSMSVANATSASHIVFGNSISGNQAGDVRQLVLAPDGTIFWVMTAGSNAAVFASNGGAPPVLVLAPLVPTDIGLVNLGATATILWYETFNRVTKPE